MKKVEMNGKKFGMLNVIKEHGVNHRGDVMWFCYCDCGGKITVNGCYLRNGDTKSCGCKNEKHGMTGSPLFTVYYGMKDRCYRNKNKNYKYYGGRGIAICDEWLSKPSLFFKWAEDNGYSHGLHIDRIDNNKNYEPHNCRFVTQRENNLNRRTIISSNRSGYNGVAYRKDNEKWRSYITILDKRLNLGCYDALKEAVIARNNYIIENDLQNDYKIQKVN